MLQRLARLIAPPSCLGCNREGSPLCSDCMLLIEPPLPRCTYCKKYNKELICGACSEITGIDQLVAVGRYSGVLRELILTMKFKHQREASQTLAGCLSSHVSALNIDSAYTITNVPTATSHIRQRGFDHTRLIATRVGNKLGLSYRAVLYRKSNRSQIGASRIRRLQQARGQFAIKASVVGADLLMIDDVVTTGASLAACTKELKLSGARSVVVLVAAQD